MAKSVDQQREVAVGRWLLKASKLIDARFADARSHAGDAVTRALTSKPDGTAKYQAVGSSKQYLTAVDRLDELHNSLAADGTSGLIRDARAAFYDAAFDHWLPYIPAVLASNAKPDRAGRQEARRLIVHGRELHEDLGYSIDSAKAALRAAVVMASARGLIAGQSEAILDAWQDRSSRSITDRVQKFLSDSDVRIFNLVGREMIKSKYLDEE